MALKINLKLFPHYQEGTFPELPKKKKSNNQEKEKADSPLIKQTLFVQQTALRYEARAGWGRLAVQPTDLLRPQQLLLAVELLASRGAEQFAINQDINSRF